MLGDDVQLGKVMEMSEKVVVGRTRGRTFSVELLHTLIKKEWGGLLKDLHKVSTLTRGLFMLKFNLVDAVSWVLGKTCSVDSSSVMMMKMRS